MEIQSSNRIQDTIHNLYTAVTQTPLQPQRLLNSAEHLVAQYNEYEISSPGQMTLSDYQHFLIAHFLVLDTTNAKYLWKRVPAHYKDVESMPNAVLNELWEVGKLLTKQNYPDAFKLIDSQRKALQQDSEQNAGGSLLRLLDTLSIMLREVHVIKMITKSYASIEYGQLKSMLGLTEQSDQEFREYIGQRGMSVNGGFVIPATHAISAAVEQDGERKRFELNEDRVQQLTQVVQFLEQQKYSFDDIIQK